MKKVKSSAKILAISLSLATSVILFKSACQTGERKFNLDAINELKLKRGEIVSCGSIDKEFGIVNFEMTCSEDLEDDFNIAMELLHSFEYDESEKAFAKIIDQSPGCAMAYWGIAMCNFHPLWEPPSLAELKKGSKAVQIAEAIKGKSKKEAAYIGAVAAYYKNWETSNPPSRNIAFEMAMEQLHSKYPEDNEATILYALALIGGANPTDKTYAKQRKAGALLSALYRTAPNHPGIIHYIIHAYDYPDIAQLALTEARRYAQVAPSSAHALHMPSHIFTRLGLWDDCIQSNTASVDAAKCYAETAAINGHWDEELHGIDYIVYGRLQKGEVALAKQQCDYINTIDKVYPVNFKDAYAFAAIPSRYCLENRLWDQAAELKIHPADFPWEKFPWQKAIFHFTRLMGFAHKNDPESARSELAEIEKLHRQLVAAKDVYKADQVMIQIKAGEAWIEWKKGNEEKAIQLMTAAADLEDGTEKHPVTPGSVIPARELLGDLFTEMNRTKDALIAYELDLHTQPNRFNGLFGAAMACRKMKEDRKAGQYFRQLLASANSGDATRPELEQVRKLLATQE